MAADHQNLFIKKLIHYHKMINENANSDCIVKHEVRGL